MWNNISGGDCSTAMALRFPKLTCVIVIGRVSFLKATEHDYRVAFLLKFMNLSKSLRIVSTCVHYYASKFWKP